MLRLAKLIKYAHYIHTSHSNPREDRNAFIPFVDTFKESTFRNYKTICILKEIEERVLFLIIYVPERKKDNT